MLKYYVCLYLFFYLIQCYSQSTVEFKQGFESEVENWSIQQLSTEPCTSEGDSWNYHNELNGILPSEGSSFWGVEDLNGNCGSSGFEFIELSTVDISELRNVQLSFDVQVKGFDNGDDIKYQLWFNGQSQKEVIIIDGENDLSTDSWETIQISIPNHVEEIKLRISIKQNGSDTAAFDNIKLTGKSVEKCRELFISEYIEGESSTSFRNNFIELYNPSYDTVNLASYKLMKFTGDNLEASKLTLSGTIAPFKTFLIEDLKEQLQIEADLSTTNSVMDFNGDDKIALEKLDTIIDIIGIIGSSGNFAKDLCLRRKSNIQSPNSEYTIMEWDQYQLDDTGNLNTHTSYCEGDFPEIEVSSLGESITDGSDKTSILNSTYFGAWPVSKDTLINRSYTIKNIGTSTLSIPEINLLGENTTYFSHNFLGPVSISPNDSIALTIFYNPIIAGLATSTIEIVNNDPSEQRFRFKIQGEGTTEVNHPLIISQYYEGSSNNKWIELTNIRSEISPADTYYLALFRNSETQSPIDSKPYRKVLIPSIAGNSSLKFCATLNVALPEYALDGNEIKTSVCTFTGDDIILISTSDAKDCWVDRTDIIGKSGNWGNDLSLIRKTNCDTSMPNTGFIETNWKELSIQAVDQAFAGSNDMIGVHHSEQTTWTQFGWSHGIPTANRTCIIASDYNTGIQGSLTACSLIIESDINLTTSAGTFVEIKKNLQVDGILEVEHNASLVMIEDSGKIDVKGSIKIHKNTSTLRPLDYTFWSSPVENAQLKTVFKASPKNSFFTFSTQEYSDENNDSQDDDDNAWIGVSGAMEIGRGYTSMAPNPIPISKIQKVVFEGPVNSGKISIPIDKQVPDSNSPSWNFLGNPYPSAMNAESMLADPINNSLLYGTFYFWTHETEASNEDSDNGQQYSPSDYAMYTIGVGGIKATKNGRIPTNLISSCQGFFIEAKSSGNLVLNNSMRTKDTDAHFFKPIKGKKEAKIWLSVSHLNDAYSQILIGFNKFGKLGFDKNYDGVKIINNQNLNLYTIVHNKKLAIQSLPEFSGNEIIRFGLNPSLYQNKILQMTIDEIEGDIANFNIIITDRLLKKKHVLNHMPYSFSIRESGSCDNRFELSFSNKEKIVSTEVETKIKWNLNENHLIVHTNTRDTIDRVEVYDLNGRKLRDLMVADSNAYINWHGIPRRAIYILKVQLSDRRKFISKILI